MNKKSVFVKAVPFCLLLGLLIPGFGLKEDTPIMSRPLKMSTSSYNLNSTTDVTITDASKRYIISGGGSTNHSIDIYNNTDSEKTFYITLSNVKIKNTNWNSAISIQGRSSKYPTKVVFYVEGTNSIQGYNHGGISFRDGGKTSVPIDVTFSTTSTGGSIMLGSNYESIAAITQYSGAVVTSKIDTNKVSASSIKVGTTTYTDSTLALKKATVEGNTSISFSLTAKSVQTQSVAFNLMDHGTAISSIQNIITGSKISEPTAPRESGYLFKGWYKEEALTNQWDFSTDVVNQDLTLYAKWEIDPDFKSVADAKTLAQTAIDSYVATNDTTSADIKQMIETAVASTGAAISISGFVLNEATLEQTGLMSFNVNITKGAASAAINSASIVIPKLELTPAQKVAAAKDAASGVIDGLTPSNDLTEAKILKAVNDAIAETGVTATISDFIKTDATKEGAGSIGGTVNLTVGGVSDTIVINKVIPIIPKTDADKVADAKSLAQATLYHMTWSNDLTEAQILKAVNDSISSTGVTAAISGFTKTEATKEGAGSIDCIVSLTLGEASDTINVNKVIPIIPKTDADKVADAKALAQAALDALPVSNEITEARLLDTANNAIVSTGVTATLNGYNNTVATKESAGSIVGTITLTLGEASDTIVINMVIPIIPKTDEDKVADAKALAQETINNLIWSNDLTEAQILEAINEAIASTGATASISGFSKTVATKEGAGSIVGTITIRLGEASDTIAISKVIPIIPKTDADKVADAKALAQTVVAGLTGSNDLTEAKILQAVNEAIASTGATATMEGFKLTSATKIADGSVIGTIKITSGTSTDTIALNLVIVKLPKTDADKIAEKETVVNQTVEDITYSTDTTKEDIEQAFSNLGGDATVVVSDYVKVDPTSDKEGSISYTVTITSGTQSKVITVARSLAKLPRNNTAIITWSVVGGLVLLLLVGYVICYFALYRKNKLDGMAIEILWGFLPKEEKKDEEKKD